MARLSRTLELEVRRRAAGRCEYCLFPESASELHFHIDHIIAEKHGGQSESENLALACFSCNLRKGPNIAGLDPDTRELTPLFNPLLNEVLGLEFLRLISCSTLLWLYP